MTWADTKSKGKKAKSSTPKDVPQADTPTVGEPSSSLSGTPGSELIWV